jgi:predicted NUDIX family phosphoesterase
MQNFLFLPRLEAEQDPGYKQIISYVVVMRGGQVFMLRRLNKGNETRLHGLISLGVGGHINPDTDGKGEDVLIRGLRREIDEEIELEDFGKLTLRGLINDDGNSVGKVHLGFFYTLETSGEVRVRETDKLKGEWADVSSLNEFYPNMETWSQIVAQEL